MSAPKPATPIGLDPRWLAVADALRRETCLLLAVSGGPDSMAMMAGLAFARDAGALGAQLHVATVDHGLRAESAQEAALVEEAAATLGLACERITLTAPEPVGSVQAWARAERYAALASSARALGAAIATAHTADDQAETFLMRAARGTGAEGLAGIRAQTVLEGARVIRPFLDWARADLHTALGGAPVGAVDDPSNADARFTRVRFRNWLADAPQPDSDRSVAAGLALSADIASRESAALDHYARDVLSHFEGLNAGYAIGSLDAEVPNAVLGRALRSALLTVSRRSASERGLDLARACEVAERLAGEPQGTWVGGGAHLNWQRKTAGIDPEQKPTAQVSVQLVAEEGRRPFPESTIEPGAQAVWDGRFEVANRSGRPICVRPWSASLSPVVLKSLPKAVLCTLPVALAGDHLVAVPRVLEEALMCPANPQVSIRFVPPKRALLP
ncbi:MAG: tRNA lysidine(34) synthetase TilS [Devosiaceae bacterium]|nr:tRNA lysidine(34) synthetase TilS [Devosiaceae bacterium MH13]